MWRKQMKRILFLPLAIMLCLCSCTSADDSDISLSSNHSIAETETLTETTLPKTDTSEDESSAYFPELLSSAAALDSYSTLTDFDRMMKEAANFDGEAFVKDHNYVLDYFTGNIFASSKLFLVYDRKTFMGKWQYGKYILNLTYSPDNDILLFYVEDIHHLSSGNVPEVALRIIENNGKDDVTDVDFEEVK